jgi:hypothetical protein
LPASNRFKRAPLVGRNQPILLPRASFGRGVFLWFFSGVVILLGVAVGQFQCCWLAGRHRLQASSHILIAFFQLGCGRPVGASLLAMNDNAVGLQIPSP